MDEKDLYFSQEHSDEKLNPEPIDNITDFGRGIGKKSSEKISPERIDNLTDFGKGIGYKANDGKYYDSMEDVADLNSMFYETQTKVSEEKGMHR